MHHRDLHQGNRRDSIARATKCVVETLEKRQLLAGNVFDVNKIPVFTPTTGDIRDTKNGPLAKVGNQGAALYIEYRSFVNKGGKASNFKTKDHSDLSIADGKLAVDIRYRGSMDNTVKLVRQLGGELIYRAKQYNIVEARVPIGSLNSLAQNAQVATINALVKARSRSVGLGNDQGVEGQNADSLQSTFNLDGEGVKVGVVSTSVNRLGNGLADSFSSGDLPPPSDIDVISDSANETDDEGRAMLEIVHDVAPKASLAYAASGDSQLTMAESIRQLFDAGCDVIVDDIGYDTEPMFQEGILNQAITNVTQAGAVYASAAGNSSSGGYETQTRWVNGTDGRTYMDWDPDPNHVDTRMRIDFAVSDSVSLQWDDPYNGVVGAPTADLDIQFFDPTTGELVFEGNSNNFTTGLPTELFDATAGVYDVQLFVNNTLDGASLPTRVVMVGQGQDGSFVDTEYKAKSQPSVQGHAGGIDTLSVGAVPFWESPAYDTDGFIESESFTSYGPNTYLFKMNGERRSQPLVANKPDLSGIDNVNTSFFGNEDVAQDPDKLLNFSGTSAASPNVAGVAALLVQLAKNRGIDYTPTTIKNALIESAKLHPTNGATSGQWDRRGGYGLIDGVAAARVLVPDVPSPDVQRIVPQDSPRGVDTMTIAFSEPVFGFDISDVSLTRKGTSVLDGKQTLTTTDNQTFVLSGLKEITNRRGTYKLMVDGSTVADADGNASFSTSEWFYVSGKPTNVVVTAISSTELNVTWFDNGVGEQGYRVYRSLDPSFTNSEVFDLGPNVTKLRDTGLVPVTRYYYKVLTVYQDISIESLPSTTVDGFTLAKNEIVLDNLSSQGVTVTGEWSSISSGNKWGVNYLTDGNSGKGDKSVTFAPNIKTAGEYLVYIRWTADDKRATKVPVTVNSSGGVKQTITVNQRQNTTWKLLGKFVFDKGHKGYVMISNTGTKGTVVADAARFVKADNGSVPPTDSGTSFE